MPKPNMNVAWAKDGEILVPPTPNIGWPAGNPTRKFSNWLENRQDTYLQYIDQYGITPWADWTVYPINGLTLGSDGALYRSLVSSNAGNDPISSPNEWVQMFDNPAVASFFSRTNIAQNLSSFTNVKIKFNLVDFDNRDDYDPVLWRWTPKLPGLYELDTLVTAELPSTGSLSGYFLISVYKNGASLYENLGVGATGQVNYIANNLSLPVVANGTDFFEIYGNHNFLGENMPLRLTNSFFSARKVS